MTATQADPLRAEALDVREKIARSLFEEDERNPVAVRMNCPWEQLYTHNQRRYYRYADAVLSALPALAQSLAPQGDFEPHHGWLFFNEDTGTEWSQNHPVRSGECPGAKTVKPATLQNLHAELMEAWRGWAEARELGPAPQGEGMREALQRAIAIVESEPEFPGLQEEVEREIKAGFDWDDLRQFPLSEICAKSMLVACRETKECIANRLREEITTLAATPIPSDRAGREEEIADEQVDAFVDAYLEAISCTEKFAPDPQGVRIGLATALRQSSVGIERAAEWRAIEELIERAAQEFGVNTTYVKTARDAVGALRSLSPSASRSEAMQTNVRAFHEAESELLAKTRQSNPSASRE